MSWTEKMRVRWYFADGTYSEIPLLKMQESLLSQFQALQAFDDIDAKEAGRRGVRQILLEMPSIEAQAIKLDAQSTQSKVSSENGSKPRPAALSLMRARVLSVMRPEKRQGIAFKVFMASWMQDPKDGLRLKQTDIEDVYRISDENADELEVAEYTDGSLRTMFSNSNK